MLQKVNLAQAVFHKPAVLLLDEPMSGLDGDAAAVCADLIRDAAGEGAAVLWTSHDEDLVRRLADRVLRIRDGVLLFATHLEEGLLS